MPIWGFEHVLCSTSLAGLIIYKYFDIGVWLPSICAHVLGFILVRGGLFLALVLSYHMMEI